MSSEPQASTNCETLTTAQEEEKYQQLFNNSKTVAEFLKHCYRERLESLLAPIPAGQTILRRMLRHYDPWPDWVLKIAVEVWSVRLPTIKKEVLYDTFRSIHFFFFEMRLDDSTQPEFPKFPKIDSQVLGSMIGHASVVPNDLRSLADKALKIGAISAEKYAEYAKEFSSVRLQSELQPHLSNYIKKRPTKWLELCDAIADAKRKTLDKQGRLKETTLTKVYSAILEDWEEIEELSGPTELCTYLKPVLDGNENDPEKRLDRVKKICRRMRIEFKPLVKGQTQSPTLSLPPTR